MLFHAAVWLCVYMLSHFSRVWLFNTISFILPCVIANSCLVAKSCPALCDPMDVAHQTPLSMGFPRQEYWSGLPFPPPGDLPHPGIKPESPALPSLPGRFFTMSHLESPPPRPCPECLLAYYCRLAGARYQGSIQLKLPVAAQARCGWPAPHCRSRFCPPCVCDTARLSLIRKGREP